MNEENVTKLTVRPSLAIETCLLIEALKNGDTGDVLTDTQLSAVCRKNTAPGGDGYGYLHSAINRVEAEYGIIWQRQRGEKCIKCLGATETLKVGETMIDRTRKIAKRATRKLALINASELDAPSLTRRNVLLAQAGTLALFARKSTTTKMIESDITNKPDLSKLIEVWK